MPTVYRCLTCSDDLELSRTELIAHLRNTHKLQSPLTYTRIPTLFLDGGQGFHQQNAELKFEGEVKIDEQWTSK